MQAGFVSTVVDGAVLRRAHENYLSQGARCVNAEGVQVDSGACACLFVLYVPMYVCLYACLCVCLFARVCEGKGFLLDIIQLILRFVIEEHAAETETCLQNN